MEFLRQNIKKGKDAENLKASNIAGANVKWCILSCSCYPGPQRLLPLPLRVLCARQVSSHTFLAASAASHCLPTSLEERTACLGLLQIHASLCGPQALPTHPNYDCCIPPSAPTWVSKGALISCFFCPLLPGWGTDAWGKHTRRGGTKTKAEPRGSVTKEEKDKYPCAATGAVD